MTVAEFINKVGFKVDESTVQEVQGTITDIKSTATKLLGAIGIGISLTQLNQMVEEFGRVNNQIKNSTSALGDQREIQEQILKAANLTRTSYALTAQTVSNLVKGNAELFGNVDEAVKFNNAATMLFKTAGKTNEEIAGLMEAINKSFQKGYVDSETISQLLERSPEAVELLNRQLGTTSSQLEEMASSGAMSVADLRDAFVNNLDAIESGFAGVQYTVSDALLHIRNEWGFWITDIDSTLKISQTVAKIMVKGFDRIMGLLNKVKNGFESLAEKVGGSENLLKIIFALASAILVVLNWSKIVTVAKNFLGVLTSIVKMITAIKLSTVLLVAVLALLFLLIDDFINFMKGNDSVIGYCFEKAGIDADEMRKKIINIWNNLKSFFSGIWNSIKAIFAPIIDFIKSKMEEVFGDDFFEGVGTGLAGFINVLEKLTSKLAENKGLQDMIGKIAVAIAALVAAFSIMKKFMNVGTTLKTIASGGKAAASGLGGTTSALGGISKTISGLGTGILAIAAGIFLLAESAIRVSEAGPGAAVALTLMIAGVAGLIAIVGAMGSKIQAGAAGMTALGAGVLMVAAAFALMAYTAVQMANSGGAAIGVLAGMLVVIVALTAIVGAFGSAMVSGGAGLALMGAGLLLCAAAMALLANTAINLANAGAPAIITLAALMVIIVAFGVACGALASLMLTGAVALAAFGAALMVVALAAVLGSAALVIMSTALPAFAEYGVAAAAGIVALGAAMLVFSPGAIAAGAAALVAMAGFTALAAASVAAMVLFAPFAAEMVAVGAAVAIMATSGTAAASALKQIVDAGKGATASMALLAAALLVGSGALVPFSATAVAGGVAATAAAAGLLLMATSATANALGLTAMALALTASTLAMTLLRTQIAGLLVSAVIMQTAFGMMQKASGPMASAMMALMVPMTLVSTAMLAFAASSVATAGSFVVILASATALAAVLLLVQAGFTMITAAAMVLTATIGSAFTSAMLQAGTVTQTQMALILAIMTMAFVAINAQVSSSTSEMVNKVQAAMLAMNIAILTGGFMLQGSMGNLMNGLDSIMAQMPSKAHSWGVDMVQGIANGMMAASGQVRGAAINIAGIISSFLHFSVPDEGPLTSYESWMPDFVGGLAQGIENNKGTIKSAVAGLADTMSVFAGADAVSPATSAAAMGATTNNSSVNQTVTIENTFNGDRAIQQEAATTMNKSADDVTASLARGLAYAR